MKLRAPSPALVISFVALVVALSATAYAATTITKSSQIRNGIVTSADIRNTTIQTRDLSKSTLSRIDGPGSASNATAFEAIRKSGPFSQPPNQHIRVATLSVPAGAYLITAKTTVAGIVEQPGLLEPGVVAATANCRLDAGGDVDQSDTTIVVESRQTPGTMYMQTARTVAAPTAITVACASSEAWHATNTSIIAQRVTSTDKKETGS